MVLVVEKTEDEVLELLEGGIGGVAAVVGAAWFGVGTFLFPAPPRPPDAPGGTFSAGAGAWLPGDVVVLGYTVTVEEVVVVTTGKLEEDATVDVPVVLDAVESVALVTELVEPLERPVPTGLDDNVPVAVELVEEPVDERVVVEFP